MLLRNPQPYPEFNRKFNELETEREHPAMPKESSYSGMPNTHPYWHDSLPQIRKVEPPAYWSAPPKKPRDIEKLTGRACIIGMALVTLLLATIFLVKIVQFSLAVTIK
jgi:hypothetical protein